VDAARARLERARADRAAQLAGLDDRPAGPPVPGRRRDRPRAGIEDYCLVRNARAALGKAEARAAAQAARQAAQDTSPGPVRNTTDPDSRLMPTRNGFIQGYNAQNVTSADGLIIATTLTRDTTDTPWFTPMLRHAQDAAALITRHHPAPASPDPGIGLMLADAGYLSAANLTTPGPDRLIATGKHRHLEKTARHATPPGSSQDPPDDPIAAMTARLATDEGITAYRQRSHIAETPHANIKHNKRFRQLTLRGLPKATAEWQFAAAIHNLFKTITTGHLTADALTALAS
jgi:hypothetical protein